MKIVFSIPHMNLGGAQRVTYNLIKWLMTNTKADVYLITFSQTQESQCFDLSLVHHFVIPGGYIKKINTIRKIIKSISPDVLITMGTSDAIFDVPACAGLKVKHIISERNDPTHFAGKILTRIMSRALMRFADGYIFQTKDAQHFYGEKISRRSVVIPNPLLHTGDMPEMQYTGKDTKIIVTAGRLNKQKNHPLLIKAFKKVLYSHPDYKLVIYGEGPERKQDERLIKELGLKERVLLPGATKDVLAKIYNASMFVFPSYFEGMPNALMEAMALGIPCISTDCPCGGPRELLVNRKSGLLVPVDDEYAMVDAINYMIEHPKESKSMGQNAMRIRETHNVDKICRMWYDYFFEIME